MVSGEAAGARAATMWHGTLSEMGMVVISSTIALGGIGGALDKDGNPIGEGGKLIDHSFPRLAADLEWWAEAAKRQHAERKPPY
jgi:hypothetical protein